MGYVCLWSLKNPSYPEYINQTHCGAMCLDFHRKHGFLLAVGFHDGHLAVYNVSLPTKEAQYMTDAVNTKHMACVRQVSFYLFLILVSIIKFLSNCLYIYYNTILILKIKKYTLYLLYKYFICP